MKKQTSQPSDEPEWRKFERLVALIETEAAPRGAIVKSPDRIPDIDTGQLREVDATIRYRAGTIDILITIECRKRNKKDDVTWIEQLATKKQKVGAAKTIAVSGAGFTTPAIDSAKRYGIELRELSKIENEDIRDWFLPHGIVHVFRVVEEVQCTVRLISGATETIDAHQPLFRHQLVHGDFPAVVFLNFIEMKEPNKFWSVPLDGTKTKLTFDIDGKSNECIPVPLGVPVPDNANLKIVLNNEVFDILTVQLSVLFSYEAKAFDRKEGEHHTYQGEEESNYKHSRFTGEVFGLTAQFDHQKNADGSESSTVKFPSGVRLPSQWCGVNNRITDVGNVDVKMLHMQPIILKGQGEKPHEGFIFTFPDEILESTESLRNLLDTHFMFVKRGDVARMQAYFSNMGKKELRLQEVDYIYQVEKSRVEYIELQLREANDHDT